MVAWILCACRNVDLGVIARDAIFADLRDGLFVLDLQQRIVDVNDTARRLLGLASVAPIGRPAAELFTGRLQPLLAVAGSSSASAELELAGDGDARSFEVRTVPLADAAGA